VVAGPAVQWPHNNGRRGWEYPFRSGPAPRFDSSRWQSTCLVNRGSRVRFLLEAPHWGSSKEERHPPKVEAAGSSPALSTHIRVAQLEVRLTTNQEDAGSSPATDAREGWLSASQAAQPRSPQSVLGWTSSTYTSALTFVEDSPGPPPLLLHVSQGGITVLHTGTLGSIPSTCTTPPTPTGRHQVF
jgi:hypothetical protein